MLTSTEPRDLITEIKELVTDLDTFIYAAQEPLEAIKTGTFGPNGHAETLRNLVQFSKPEEPQHPTETLWNALWSIEELTHEAAALETQGGALYARLLRMADLLELRV